MITEASVAQARPFEDLDAAPLAVNVQNGTLIFSVDEGGSEGGGRVSGVQLVPHNRDLMQSKMMDVAYDPNATCPQFVAFLERVMPDAQMRAFLQRWFGLSMTALTGEQKLAFLYGQGANGKSVLMDLLGRILGDYAATAKIESLTGTNRRGGGDATPDLIPLMGARLVRAAEPEQGTRFQEAMIKDLLGGESMLVRQLQKEFVEVKPKFKLTISGNHKPEIRGTDDGIWRRVMLVPFDVQIPKAERDPLLGEKLWEERAGILNWLTGGLLDYLDGGLREPSTVTEATTEYRRDSDPLGTFLSDATDITGADEDWMTAKDLIAAAAFWMDDNIGGAWGTRTLSLRLKEKAGRWRHPDNGKCYTPAKRGVTGYKGIRLSREFERRRMEAGGQEAGTIPAQASYTPPDWDGDL
jgi:putative DNA primase/helicase